MTPHTPQLKGVIERIFAIIKEGVLEILLNVKPNEDTQKIMWDEAIRTCKCLINVMVTTGSTTSPFRNFYGEKPKIVGSFSEFVCIGHVTKRENFKKQMIDKPFN